MANNENLIPIPGRLHSVATEGHVAGADEIYDDTQQKNQATINSELIAAVGTGSSVDTKISNAINALDATASQSTGNDGLALSVTEENGKVTAISGSIAANTYDAHGAASTAKNEVLGTGVGTDYNTLKKIEDKLSPIETAVGSGGSIDTRIANAVAAETTRAETAEGALDTAKADKATTLAGYGITDAYTKTEMDDAVEDCAYLGEDDGSAVIADFDPQTDTVWKKAQVLSAAEKEQVQQNIGVREWLNTLTGEKYVSVAATDQTTTSNLKALIDTAAGSAGKEQADTIYRVGKWDGSAYNEEYYSDYAWDGSAYVQLNKKSIVGEVFDITEYKAGAKYADLAAALGTNGENVPQNVRKGGMLVKYVNTDNNYVQFRYTGTAVTGNPNPFLDIANWQGVDDEPTSGSNNMVKSGGVFSKIVGGAPSISSYISKWMAINNTWEDTEQSETGAIYTISKGDIFHIKPLSAWPTYYAFLSSIETDSVHFMEGETSRHSTSAEVDITSPDNGYLYVGNIAPQGHSVFPDVFYLYNGVSSAKGISYSNSELRGISNVNEGLNKILDITKNPSFTLSQTDKGANIFTYNNNVIESKNYPNQGKSYKINIPKHINRIHLIGKINNDTDEVMIAYALASQNLMSTIDTSTIVTVAPHNSINVDTTITLDDTYHWLYVSMMSYNQDLMCFPSKLLSDIVFYDIHKRVSDEISIKEQIDNLGVHKTGNSYAVFPSLDYQYLKLNKVEQFKVYHIEGTFNNYTSNEVLLLGSATSSYLSAIEDAITIPANTTDYKINEDIYIKDNPIFCYSIYDDFILTVKPLPTIQTTLIEENKGSFTYDNETVGNADTSFGKYYKLNVLPQSVIHLKGVVKNNSEHTIIAFALASATLKSTIDVNTIISVAPNSTLVIDEEIRTGSYKFIYETIGFFDLPLSIVYKNKDNALKTLDVNSELPHSTVFSVANLENATPRIPTLAVTNNGTLVAFCSQRAYPNPSDYSNNDIVCSISYDFGRTWGTPFKVMTHTEDRIYDCISALVDTSNNRLYLVSGKYDNINKWEEQHTLGYAWDLVYKYSDNNGSSWSEELSLISKLTNPERLSTDIVCILAGDGHGITMADGTLVINAQCKMATDNTNNSNPAPYNIQSCILYSTDNGESWTLSSLVPCYSSECEVVEYEEGKLAINCRSYIGHRRVYYTEDMGNTWNTAPVDQQVIEPHACQGSFHKVQMGYDSKIYSFNPQSSSARVDMTICEFNGIQSASPKLLVSKLSGGGYSDLNSWGKHLFCLYEYNTYNFVNSEIRFCDCIDFLKI